MPVLFKVKEGGKLHRSEYINISRIAIWPLTLDLGKKGYLSTASLGRQGCASEIFRIKFRDMAEERPDVFGLPYYSSRRQ